MLKSISPFSTCDWLVYFLNTITSQDCYFFTIYFVHNADVLSIIRRKKATTNKSLCVFVRCNSLLAERLGALFCTLRLLDVGIDGVVENDEVEPVVVVQLFYFVLRDFLDKIIN